MFETILADLDVTMGRDAPKSFWQIVKFLDGNFGAQAVIVYRFGRWLQRQPLYLFCLVVPLKLLYWLMRAAVIFFYDIRLDLSADIGPGFRIWHFGGITVSRCLIGTNCTIHQLVKIVPELQGTGPTLGDNVWVGPHAEIVGAVTVGSGVAISAASCVKSNIPARSLVMGRPARVVKMDYDNRDLYS